MDWCMCMISLERDMEGLGLDVCWQLESYTISTCIDDLSFKEVIAYLITEKLSDLSIWQP